MLKRFSIHSILIFVSLLSIFPFIWLTSTSLKGISEDIFAYPPNIIPKDFTWNNYIEVWHQVDFMAYFWNSLIVAGLTVVLNLILSSLAAYPLARMTFKGKKIFFFSIIILDILYVTLINRHINSSNLIVLLPFQSYINLF